VGDDRRAFLGRLGAFPLACCWVAWHPQAASPWEAFHLEVREGIVMYHRVAAAARGLA
jgi:hypothetical protein